MATTTGSCLCGAIALAYTGEPALTAVCHCKDCQKWAGSGNSTNVAVLRKNFEITKGTPRYYNVVGGSGKDYPHFFCGGCGTSLYGQPESMPDLTLVRAGVLDNGASDIKVVVEFFTKDRRNFVSPIEEAKQFATMT